VVAVEKALFLLAVQRVVGGVEVQHQLLGRSLEAGDELLDQQLAQVHRRGPIGPARQAAQRGRTGHLAIHAHGRLHRHALPQRLVVVQVLPPQSQTVHALAQHVAHRVRDQQRITRVCDAARRRRRQPDLAVRGRQQHHAPVTGHAATVEATLDLAAAHPRPPTRVLLLHQRLAMDFGFGFLTTFRSLGAMPRRAAGVRWRW
jgi:hypothetical protein